MMKRTLTLLAAAVTSVAISTQASTAASNLPQNIGSAGFVSASSDVQLELVGYKFHNGRSKGRHGFNRGHRTRSGNVYHGNRRGHQAHHGRQVHHGHNGHNGHNGHGVSSKHHEHSSKHKKVLILKKLFN